MLTRIELQLQLPFILGLLHLYRLEQLPNVVLCQEGTAQYSHNYIDASVEFKRPFNYCNSTVRDDSHINLYTYSIFSISPEGLNSKVPFHPFEERLYSPSVFIQECNIPCLQVEVVRIVREGSFQIGIIIHNSPDLGWIVFSVPFRNEPNSIVPENIIDAIKKVFTVCHLKHRPSFFPYYEKRVEHFNTVQSAQIPVPTIKNLAGKWFVFDPIHGIHIMNGCFRDVDKCKTKYVNASKTKMVSKREYKTHYYGRLIKQPEGSIMGKSN